MISFLFGEGVITTGTLSGLFTAAMLNSFRINILEPCVENIAPSHTLDNILDSVGNIMNNNESNQSIPGQAASASSRSNIVKWKTFLRDFLTWALIMILLYIFWKTVLCKYRKKPM
jgi:hypothetical protein